MRSRRRLRALLVCVVAMPLIGVIAVATTASADQPRCGGDLPPACPVITSVTPSLLYSSELPARLTLTGTALDNPTRASLMPIGRSLDFAANSSSSLSVTLPDDIGEGTYTVEVIASGFTATSPHLAVLNGNSTTQSQGSGVGAAPPPPKTTATPGSHPAVSAPAAPLIAPGAPAPGFSWGVIIAAGVLAGAMAAAYLGIRWRLAMRRRYREMDIALDRLWTLNEEADLEAAYPLLQWRRQPPRRTLTDSIRDHQP